MSGDIKNLQSSPSYDAVTPDDVSTSMENGEITFDLSIVLEEFKKCKSEDGQIMLDSYLRGYLEVNKFFQILGNVFNFVASDVQKKVSTLQCYRQGGGGQYYYSIQSMIEYEKDLGTIDSPDMTSGSRHLLRLNRALEFIVGFLEELKKAEEEMKLGSATTKVYSNTLAKYHGWVLAKTVKVALLLMPTKKNVVDKVTKGNQRLREQNETMLPEVVEVMRSVFNLVQKLYEDYEILNLP